MRYLFILVVFVSNSLFAGPFEAKGFHWYNVDEPKKEVKHKKESNSPITPSMYKKLMEKRAQAKESLATAILEPTVDNTADYMRKQKEFQDLNTQFVRNWKIALLLHPELDATLENPVDNNAIAMKNDQQSLLMEKVIHGSRDYFGLLIFYKGNSTVSQKFIQTVKPYLLGHKISIISASTDGVKIDGLPNSVVVPQEKAERILNVKRNYQPAVFMVNLRNQEIKPVSYGFASLTEFKKRYFDALTNFNNKNSQGIK